MKNYTVYVCETCGKESRDGREILTCEGSHIGNGLTFEEYERYRILKELCQAAGARLSSTNNDETRKIFDDTINQLMEFETAHGIK